MADILIREFEMPETCGQCPIFNFDYNICNILSTHHHEYETSRIYGCPLHELPEHGDLISREEALSMPFANGKYDHENADEHFIYGCETYKEWLEQLPVVIPSNKEEEIK